MRQAEPVRRPFRRLAALAGAVAAFLPVAAFAADGPPIPHELSPLAMFLAADVVVKGVMIGLAAASVATWTVLIAKTIELGAARRRVRRAVAVLTAEATMAEAAQRLDRNGTIGRALIEAAAEELRQSAHATDKAGIKERVASRIQRIEIAAAKAMTRGTGLLATIGSTAPFVGLFGTVWGIMNSFIGISKAQTTNLAVVAPGIAEALLATAIGLVAAIPAVVIYNHFSRGIAGYKIAVGDAAAAVMRLVSRDLDSGHGLRAVSKTGT